MRWKRVKHWKQIRTLIDDHGVPHAHIERGRKPYEYVIVFGGNNTVWERGHWHKIKKQPDYVLPDSTLATAKALGLLIVKTQGETE